MGLFLKRIFRCRSIGNIPPDDDNWIAKKLVRDQSFMARLNSGRCVQTISFYSSRLVLPFVLGIATLNGAKTAVFFAFTSADKSRGGLFAAQRTG